MKILFCVPGSPGFIFPSIGIAKRLIKLGHTCLFVTSNKYKSLLDQHSIFSKTYSGNSSCFFEIQNWFKPDAIYEQFLEVKKQVIVFSPDIIISFQHVISTYLIKEIYSLPLIIIGLATTVWPKDIDYINKLASSYFLQRQHLRLLDWVSVYNKFRASLGFAPFTIDRWFELYGDLFLLRSIPQLEPLNSNHVPVIRHVGPCLWEPRSCTDFFNNCNYDAKTSKKLVYIQHGHYFDGSEFLNKVLSLLSRNYLSLVDVGRYDGIKVRVPNGTIVSKSIPLSVIKHCSFAISTGSSTPVLAALQEGKPLILFPNGSGTNDIALQCEKNGLGFVLDSASFTKASIDSCIDKINFDETLHTKLALIKKEISIYGGINCAVHEVLNFVASH